VTVDDIFRLPDVTTGLKILRAWGISCKGLDNKKAVQDVILQHWLSKEETRQEETEEVVYISVVFLQYKSVFIWSNTFIQK
jgi:hypothetical protein